MPYKGELQCEATKASGEACTNRAYYEKDGKYMCGVHAKGERIELVPNPQAKKIEETNLQEHAASVEKAAAQNRKEGKRGSVTVDKMHMRKKVELVPGYLNIFPNYRHGERKDGIGMPSLSPMSLGPIALYFPKGDSDSKVEVLEASCLENAYQGSKVYARDVENDILTPEALDYMRAFFADKTPHRHKYERGEKPLYAIYWEEQGKDGIVPIHASYMESRYFYCTWYTRLVKEEKDFAELCRLIKEGYNLRIMGYDGYAPLPSTRKMYADISKPFGHEMVLYTLLTRKHYPWE